ncbi:MAG: winged helix-turn-helix domain-containing protein [Nanoarchaeota archaeon]
MEKIDVLKELFDEKILEILKLFLQNKEKQYYLSEISTATAVSIATTYRIINKLLASRFIEELGAGKFKVYRLANNEKARFLEEILKREINPIDIFIGKASKLSSRLLRIILKEESSTSAKLLIIGDLLQHQDFEKISKQIRNEHNFTISFLILSSQQFKQMSEFYNLENETILWERKY